MKKRGRAQTGVAADRKRKRIEGEVVHRVKKQKAEDEISSWFITVNTHLSKNKLSKEQIRRAEEEFSSILEDIYEKEPDEYIVFNEGEATKSKIKSIQNYYKIEFQKINKARQLHSHNYLQIKHSTNIHLDYRYLKELFKEKIRKSEFFKSIADTGAGGISPHVHIELASRDGNNEREYMEKGTHTVWKKSEVSDYYRQLRETLDENNEHWDRFTRIEKNDENFIPEGYIPI